jgi:hypothetical protein
MPRGMRADVVCMLEIRSESRGNRTGHVAVCYDEGHQPSFSPSSVYAGTLKLYLPERLRLVHILVITMLFHRGRCVRTKTVDRLQIGHVGNSTSLLSPSPPEPLSVLPLDEFYMSPKDIRYSSPALSISLSEQARSGFSSIKGDEDEEALSRWRS